MNGIRVIQAWAAALAIAFALPVAAADTAGAGGTTEISMLGGRNAFCHPPLKTPADLQKLFEKMGKDVETALAGASWRGNNEDLFRAVSAGEIQEAELPIGGTLQWMVMRKRGKVAILNNVRWAGKAPVPMYKITVTSNDVRYTFVIPRACGNLALMDETSVVHPNPICKLTITPSSDCISRMITIDASGSSAVEGSIKSIEVKCDGPGGKSESLGATTTNKWTKTYTTPGAVTCTAIVHGDNGKSSEPCTARAEMKACPPTCALTVSKAEVLEGETFSLDGSGSKAQVGNLTKVGVEVVNAKGEKTEDVSLTPPAFHTDMKLNKSGAYNFKGVAEDDLGQRSTGACDGEIFVWPRLTFLLDFFGGKERRVRPEQEFGGSCAGLVGAKAGLSYRTSEHIELVAAVGGAYNVEESSHSILFLDGELNYYAKGGFFGVGAGAWDLGNSDTRTGSALVHAGVNLINKPRKQPIFLFVEGRMLFDSSDDIENNYVLWGGLRFHIH